MNCEAFRDRVFDFLEGGLADRAAFEAHRAGCAGCADILRGIQLNERILRGAAVPAAPPELWSRIAAAIPRPAPRIRLGPWAAAALFLIGILSFAFRPAPSLKIQFKDVSPEAARALAGFVPRYEAADGGLALGDYVLRND